MTALGAQGVRGGGGRCGAVLERPPQYLEDSSGNIGNGSVFVFGVYIILFT